MKKDIILSGVGGQGILSIATVIGQAALNDGLYMGSYPELINMPFLESCVSSSYLHTVVSN